MFKILTLNKISKCGTDQLPGSYSISDDEKNPDGIMLRSFNMHEMELSPELKAVARAGAGVNNIPVDACSEKGIVVFNTPGANANAVKELAIAGLLISSRKIVDGVNWARSLKGQTGVAGLVEKGKAEFIGPEILGKKLGVVGLGAIGVLVANACNSLGMEVLGYDPFISVDAAWSLSRSIRKATNPNTIYEECDYISIHIPLNADTKGMFNTEILGKMKKGVRILNFSRAELIDSAAMKQALESGRVGCYVTDFPTDEVMDWPNTITIPHLGASTPESEDNCAIMAASQLRDYLETGNIKNAVNFPDCDMPYTGKRRVGVIHKNIPNVVGPVTTVFAHKSINIDNMLNKSKGNYAYTMIDVDQDDVTGIDEELMKIDGVIRVRIVN